MVRSALEGNRNGELRVTECADGYGQLCFAFKRVANTEAEFNHVLKYIMAQPSLIVQALDT